MKKFKTEFFLGAAILFWVVAPVWSQGGEMTIEQTLSDEGQRTTIAFDALAFLTGTLGADSFFPPGKVADFWGFQYLRDNDPTQMGHNTDFLTKAAENVLFILTPAQLDELESLAQSQVDDINQYAYDRFVLMKAFRRLLDRDVPKGRRRLNIDAIKAYSAKLYQLDGQISIQRAEVMGRIIQSLDAGQRSYLDTMVGRGMLTWQNVPNSLNPRDYTHDVHVAIMTYATDIFSWYAGSLDAAVYFCPERQGTYFGSFYLKGAPAVGTPNYSISPSLTRDMGNAFLAALTPTQSRLVTRLVKIQKPWLYEIVNVRREICSLLRKAMAGEALESSTILSLTTRYGELDGEIIYSYATNFVRIYRTLSAEQKDSLTALRKKIIGDLAPEGAYLYSEQIPMPDIPNTDFLFGRRPKV